MDPACVVPSCISKEMEYAEFFMWPAKLKGLECFESLLNCTICSDFFDGAVIGPCGHTYCAVCIDKVLRSNDGLCPTCKTKVRPSAFVPCSIINEIVIAFKQLRQPLVDIFCSHVNENILDSNPIVSTDININRKKKRKIDNDFNVVDLSQNDVDDNCLFATCPVCSTRVLSTEINDHTNLCLDGNNTTKNNRDTNSVIRVKAQLTPFPKKDSTIVSTIREKIPVRVYTSYSLKQLRAEALSFSLSSSGSRSEVETRIKSYVQLYNAEAMKQVNQKSVDEIRLCIETNESILFKESNNVHEIAKEVKVAANDTAAYNALCNNIKSRQPARDDSSSGISFPWRCIYSEKLQRPVYYNPQTQVMQVDLPSEVRNWITNFPPVFINPSLNVHHVNHIITMDKKETNEMTSIE